MFGQKFSKLHIRFFFGSYITDLPYEMICHSGCNGHTWGMEEDWPAFIEFLDAYFK